MLRTRHCWLLPPCNTLCSTNPPFAIPRVFAVTLTFFVDFNSHFAFSSKAHEHLGCLLRPQPRPSLPPQSTLVVVCCTCVKHNRMRAQLPGHISPLVVVLFSSIPPQICCPLCRHISVRHAHSITASIPPTSPALTLPLVFSHTIALATQGDHKQQLEKRGCE